LNIQKIDLKHIKVTLIEVINMSVASRGYEPGLEGELPVPLKKIWEFLRCLLVNKEINHFARLYHADFSYGLVPDTAIRDFNNMNKITSLYSGDCYVYVFQRLKYQGAYRIVSPGERIGIDECGSLIISTHPISIDEVQKNGRAPEYYWEMTGPMYMAHFSAAYRYA